jgi:hypothetical protein
MPIFESISTALKVGTGGSAAKTGTDAIRERTHGVSRDAGFMGAC